MMHEDTSPASNTPNIFALTEAHLLGQLDEAQTKAFDALLLSDADARKQCALAIDIMSTVHEEFRRREENAELNANEPLLEDFNAAMNDLMQMEQRAEVIDHPLETFASEQPPHQPNNDNPSVKDLISLAGYLSAKAIKSRPAQWLAAAAVILLGVTLFIVLSGNDNTPEFTTTSDDMPTAYAEQTPRGSDPQTTPTVATLTNTHNAVWSEGASAPGSQLRSGQRLTLTQGFAEITTNRGAVAILEAPATIELTDSDNAIHLHSGKLVGICETDSSKGFLIRTPHMDITDLGTRFGVDASSSESTQVQVLVGSVQVQPTSAEQDAEQPILLIAGQAAQASGDGGLMRAAFETDRYVWDLSDRLVVADTSSNPYAIANPSFEWSALEDNTLNRKDVPGWALSATGAGVVCNPGEGLYEYYDLQKVSDTNGGSIGAMSGRCMFFFSADTTGGSLTQRLNAQAEVGVTYTLTVAVGDRPAESSDRPDFAGYVIELLAGDQVLAKLDASPDQSPGEGTFTDVTLTHTVLPTDPTGALGIRLSTNRAEGTNQVTDFDNIRLTSIGPADAEPARNP